MGGVRHLVAAAHGCWPVPRAAGPAGWSSRRAACLLEGPRQRLSNRPSERGWWVQHPTAALLVSSCLFLLVFPLGFSPTPPQTRFVGGSATLTRPNPPHFCKHGGPRGAATSATEPPLTTRKTPLGPVRHAGLSARRVRRGWRGGTRLHVARRGSTPASVGRHTPPPPTT